MFELLLGVAALATQEAESGPDAATALAARTEAARRETINLAPPRRTLSILDGGEVSLEVSEKKSELTLGYAWDRVRRQVTEDGFGLQVSHSTVNVGVTLPIGGADNLLSSETFDGFAAGPSIQASWTWFGWTSRDRMDGPEFGRIMEQALRNCLAREQPADRARLCEPYRGRRNTAFAERYSGYSIGRINNTLVSSALGFGIQGELGFDVFDYRTPLTLVENSQTEPNFSATASVFYFPSDGVSLLTGSVEYKNAFEAQRDQILCRAVIADPNTDCVRAPPGPPSNVESLSLGLEYRRVIGELPGLGRFAIAPQASYDVIGDHYRLELPLYLTPPGNSAFLPGLSVSYDSEGDEFVFGVFLRKTFSLAR